MQFVPELQNDALWEKDEQETGAASGIARLPLACRARRLQSTLRARSDPGVASAPRLAALPSAAGGSAAAAVRCVAPVGCVAVDAAAGAPAGCASGCCPAARRRRGWDLSASGCTWLAPAAWEATGPPGDLPRELRRGPLPHGAAGASTSGDCAGAASGGAISAAAAGARAPPEPRCRTASAGSAQGHTT